MTFAHQFRAPADTSRLAATITAVLSAAFCASSTTSLDGTGVLRTFVAGQRRAEHSQRTLLPGLRPSN